MKNNIKKVAGAGALGLALLSSLSMGAFAAEADTATPIETDCAKAVLMQTDGTGWTQISADRGKTWQDGDPAALVTDAALFQLEADAVDVRYSVDIETASVLPADGAEARSDVSMTMSKIDEDTGRIQVSTDGGETWEEVNLSHVMPYATGGNENQIDMGDFTITFATAEAE